MQIKPLNKPANIQNVKLPRYLYHFTNGKSAKAILEDGVINTTYDGRGIMIDGVFMVDFQNLIKSWSKFFITEKSMQISLLTCLLGQVAKGDNEIACFRIPSNELESTTVIRSQNELKKMIDSGEDFVPIFSKGEKYKLYQRNGHSIEYIHHGKIKVKNKHLIGTANLTKILEEAFINEDFDKTKTKSLIAESIKTLKALFAKEPERKTLDTFNIET